MNTGVYEIVNTTNGKCYIGSAVNFTKRWREHKRSLSSGKHHSRHLQHAWTKYGENAFDFRKLLVCSKEHLIMYEQRAIDAIASEYNIARIDGSTLGVIPTSEKLAKMSAAKKGKPSGGNGRKHSAETKAKMSASLMGRTSPTKGRKSSLETRAKISATKKGRPSSFKGSKHTEAAKEKMSISLKGRTSHNKGKKSSLETRAKLSATHIGKRPSDETRAKLSAIKMAQSQETRAAFGRMAAAARWPKYAKQLADEMKSC